MATSFLVLIYLRGAGWDRGVYPRNSYKCSAIVKDARGTVRFEVEWFELLRYISMESLESRHVRAVDVVHIIS